MTDKVQFTSPIGRLVSGDAYEAQTKDMDGNPLVFKSGPDMGKPRVNFYVGVAIPKTPNVPWENEPWGQLMVQVAKSGVPNAFDPNTGQLYQGRPFAFKVTDGDSIIPNKKQKRPCDNPGYPGNWVVNFSNGFAPKICNADGSAYITEPNAVKRGYFVQVLCTIGANNNASNPGIYLNHELIALAAYGEEIQGSIDPSQAGFGGVALPVGASAVPLTAMNNQGAVQDQAAQQQAVIQQQQVAQQQVAQQQATTLPPPATDLVSQQNLAPPATVVQPESTYEYNGQVYNKSVLLAMPGWTEAHLAGLKQLS